MKSMEFVILLSTIISAQSHEQLFVPKDRAKKGFTIHETFNENSKVVCAAIANAKNLEAFYQDGNICQVGNYDRSYTALEGDELIELRMAPERSNCSRTDLQKIGTAGYILETTFMSYTDARDNCIEKYGGNLAVLHQSDYFNAANVIVGNTEVWIGLQGFKHPALECTDAACNGKATWIDGSSLVYKPFMHEVYFNDLMPRFCVSKRANWEALGDKDCDVPLPSLCQVFC